LPCSSVCALYPTFAAACVRATHWFSGLPAYWISCRYSDVPAGWLPVRLLTLPTRSVRPGYRYNARIGYADRLYAVQPGVYRIPPVLLQLVQCRSAPLLPGIAPAYSGSVRCRAHGCPQRTRGSHPWPARYRHTRYRFATARYFVRYWLRLRTRAVLILIAGATFTRTAHAAWLPRTTGYPDRCAHMVTLRCCAWHGCTRRTPHLLRLPLHATVPLYYIFAHRRACAGNAPHAAVLPWILLRVGSFATYCRSLRWTFCWLTCVRVRSTDLRVRCTAAALPRWCCLPFVVGIALNSTGLYVACFCFGAAYVTARLYRTPRTHCALRYCCVIRYYGARAAVAALLYRVPFAPFTHTDFRCHHHHVIYHPIYARSLPLLDRLYATPPHPFPRCCSCLLYWVTFHAG